MENFIEFAQSLFPSINPYTAASVKQSIRQFLNGNSGNCLTSDLNASLVQGDIIFDLPFVVYGIDGAKYTSRFPAIVLSNSCDIENDDYIAVAPLQPISKFKINNDAIMKNTFFSLFYIPDNRINDYVINFGLINTFPKKPIEKALEEGKIKRNYSLNLFGYYFFLCKLTIHFMRPEDTELQDLRAKTT